MSYGCTLVDTGDIEVSQNYSDYDHLIIDNTYWVACFLRVRQKKCDKQLSGLFPYSKLTAMNVLRGNSNESKWPIGPRTPLDLFGFPWSLSVLPNLVKRHTQILEILAFSLQ